MQEPGRRPFAGVDLRRPKGYPAAAPTATTAVAAAPVKEEEAGDPCPRCESRDTKFCYYNNYNTSQPRHYCRSAASPKRAKNSKRRRIAPPEPEPGATDAAGAAEKEAIAGAIGCPATEVDAARDAANGTVCGPAIDVEDAARTEATANGAVDAPASAVDAAGTEATANGPMDDAGAPPAADDVDPSVALGLGVADAGGKEPSDANPFEWPSGCDLGSYSYWAPGVFADIDPVLFLNLP